MPPPSTPHFSTNDWNKLRAVLRSVTFYRIWFLGVGSIIILWSLHNLHRLGWGAQPLYMICLTAFWFTTAQNICSRCIHFDSWHCGGFGKAAARLFDLVPGPISPEARHRHFILMALSAGATLLGLFSGGLLPGAMGIIWIAGASFAVVPHNRPFSWSIGRRRTTEIMAELRNPQSKTQEPSATEPAEDMVQPNPGLCQDCGVNIPEKTRFCPSCGAEVSNQFAPSPKGKKPAAKESANPTEAINMEAGIPLIDITDEGIKPPGLDTALDPSPEPPPPSPNSTSKPGKD